MVVAPPLPVARGDAVMGACEVRVELRAFNKNVIKFEARGEH